MRLVFCGTPRFAIPTLERLLEAGHSIQLVVTQPDRAAGRRAELLAPPIKLLALQAGLPVVQPGGIKNNSEFAAQIQSIRPEAIVVVAYGRIIPKWMIDLPPLGNLNLHASLLPKYRGAAPVQWAIARGERVTGVTTMRIDEGLDTGDILLQRELPIPSHRTAEEFAPLLAGIGASLMVETLAGLLPGAAHPIVPMAQDHSRASHAPLLKREDAHVDFRHSAKEIYDRWRGFQPWPGAYTFLRGAKLTIHRMAPAPRRNGAGGPGEITVVEGRLFVTAADGLLELMEVQLEGKKRLHAVEFQRGAAIRSGERLGA